jgi:hypothetical protein
MIEDLYVNPDHLVNPVYRRRKPKLAERFFGELRDSASSIRLPHEDHSDNTNAIRSLRCAAVKALKLFLAVVA